METTGYFTVTNKGVKRHRLSFELAAYAAYHHSEIERIIEVERIIVAGQVSTRERDVTSRALDFLSSF